MATPHSRIPRAPSPSPVGREEPNPTLGSLAPAPPPAPAASLPNSKASLTPRSDIPTIGTSKYPAASHASMSDPSPTSSLEIAPAVGPPHQAARPSVSSRLPSSIPPASAQDTPSADAAARKLRLTWQDWVFVVYLVLHIPITALVDSQCVIPASFYPEWALQLTQWHIEMNGDYLVGGASKGDRNWFWVLISNEIAVQLPLFFVCAYGLIRCRPWVRQVILLYSVHAVTCMIPILGDMIVSGRAGSKLPQLLGTYVAWLVLPAWMFVRFIRDEDPFVEKRGKDLKLE